MTPDLKGIGEILKHLPRYFLGIFIASGLLLFGPGSLIYSFGLRDIVANLRPYIGGAFLISGIFSIIPLGNRLLTSAARWVKSAKHTRGLKRQLRGLTPGERLILADYVVNDTSSRMHTLNNGIVKGLEHKKIIYCSTQLSDPYGRFAFNVQPWAKGYLWTHPEVLDPELAGLRAQLQAKKSSTLSEFMSLETAGMGPNTND